MTRLFALGLLAFTMSGFTLLAADLKEEMKLLNGTWRPKSADMAGKAMATEAIKAIKLVIADEKYTVTVGETEDRGTLKIDPTKKPKTMDIIGTDGPNKGKTYPAIYEISGNTLKVCYDLNGKTRPTEFKTATGTMLFMVTYEREKMP